MVEKLLLGVFLVLLSISSGSALKCYSCSSYQNATCGDPFNATAVPDELTVDCPDNKTLCAKFVSINYEISGGVNEVRSVIVSRMCATEDTWPTEAEEGCDNQESDGGYSKECYCKGDLCNHSNSIIPSFITLILAVLASRGFYKL